MKTAQLMEGWQFHEDNPFAQPLHVAADGRIPRFALHKGQTVREHMAPNSPVYIVILSGQGMFTGAKGKEELYGPHTLVMFDAGEEHSIRALDDDLVFVAFLNGAPGYT